MSQFRKSASYYLSQWEGDDLNTGTDPTLPIKSISSIPSTTLLALLGAGYYPIGANTTANLEGDGKTIVVVTGFLIAGTLNKLTIYAASSFGGFTQFTSGSEVICINGSHNARSGASKIKWVFYNAILSGTLNGVIINSVFESTSVFNFGLIAYTNQYNYFGSQSLITANTATQLTGVTNCCINGIIRIGGIDYEVKKTITGAVRPDSNPAYLDIETIAPNFCTTQANYSGDPKFIDIFSRTVEPDSILLQKSNANGYIGGVKIGKKIDLDESGFTITKTGIDDSNPNFWKIATGVDFAKIRITGKVSDSLISAQTLDIRIPFNFDGDVAGNTATNNNVPDAWNDRTTPDTKGTKPNRLTFEVRSSTLANPSRDVSADWDNDSTNSPSIAGQYYLMEYGQTMLHHVISAVAYGNADANAINAATKLPFNYRSLDIIITISNTREI